MASALVWGSINALLADTTIDNDWPEPNSQDATLCSDYSGGCPTGASPIADAATFVGGDACACCTTIAALARVSAGPECACTIDCNSASGDEPGFADCCCSSGPMWSGSVRGAFHDVCVYGHTLSGVERPGPCCSDAVAPSISAVQASCPTQVTACACEEELTSAFAAATVPADAGPSPELEEIFRCMHCSYIDCDTSSGDEMEHSDCCMQGNWHWGQTTSCDPACAAGLHCCSDGQTCAEFESECPSCTGTATEVTASCIGTATEIAPSCTGTAVSVPASCTGTATDGTSTCDLEPGTDNSAACPAGCDDSPAFTPTCDLEPGTDGTAACPAGCTEIGPLTPTCDLDPNTDGTAVCPAGCTVGGQTGTCDPACGDGEWCCPDGQCAADAAACPSPAPPPSPGPPACDPACQDDQICCSDGQTCVEFESECPHTHACDPACQDGKICCPDGHTCADSESQCPSPCDPACADGQWCCPNGQCAADAAACGQVG